MVTASASTPSLESETAPESGAVCGDSTLRRIADLAVSAPLLVLLAPLFALIAIAVKLDSPGPVYFVQERIGRGRRPFPMFKFRSMRAGADKSGPSVSGRKDPRITRVGAFLRSSKLDELPQILNVLRGEMTLIGPRAEVARYIPHYTRGELRILDVRPGLTGPGQIHFTTDQSGALDGVADPEAHYIEHQLHAKLALDLDYLRHRTFARDLGALLRTMALLLGLGGRREPS